MILFAQSAREFLYETSNIRVDETLTPTIHKLKRHLILAADELEFRYFGKDGPEKYEIEREPTIPDAIYWLGDIRHGLAAFKSHRRFKNIEERIKEDRWAEVSGLIGQILAFHALRSGWIFAGTLMDTDQEFAIPLNYLASGNALIWDYLSDLICNGVRYHSINVYRTDRPPSSLYSGTLPQFPTETDLREALSSASPNFDEREVLGIPPIKPFQFTHTVKEQEALGTSKLKSIQMDIVPSSYEHIPLAAVYRPLIKK